MSITETYSRVHDAMLTTADRHSLKPYDVRLLVALLERDGEARTDDLERDLCSEGTSIRRSSLALRDAQMITAWSSAPGRPPKRGVRSHLSLTLHGHVVAQSALALARADEAVAA